MSQVDSDSDHEALETNTNQLDFVAPLILAELTHLNLAGRLISKKAKFVSGGAYGDISKGRCIFTDQGTVKVAIKCLCFYLKEDIELLFEKEIYVWSKLRHANTRPLLGYDIDETSGYPLLVSEWMSNGSAWTYVNSQADCDLVHLVVGIARGLAYLHENGIVHSDVKSDNILVSDSGDALICDFGCSRMIAASRSLANLSSGIRGTSRYLAYELLAASAQFHEVSIGHTTQTDVWAFGMTVFELLTRQRPYAHLSEIQVIAAITRLELPSFPLPLLLNLQLDVFQVLRDVCLSCWNENPASRPAIGLALDMLVNWAKQQSTHEVRGSRDMTFLGPAALLQQSVNRKRPTTVETKSSDIAVERAHHDLPSPRISSKLTSSPAHTHPFPPQSPSLSVKVGPDTLLNETPGLFLQPLDDRSPDSTAATETAGSSIPVSMARERLNSLGSRKANELSSPAPLRHLESLLPLPPLNPSLPRDNLRRLPKSPSRSPPPLFGHLRSNVTANNSKAVERRDEMWPEIKLFLGYQSKYIMYDIQSVLSSVRTPTPPPSLDENLTHIITTVSRIVAICKHRFPPSSSQAGGEILRELSDHANKLSEMQSLQELTKEARQVMAKSSFAIASAIKVLASL